MTLKFSRMPQLSHTIASLCHRSTNTDWSLSLHSSTTRDWSLHGMLWIVKYIRSVSTSVSLIGYGILLGLLQRCPRPVL